MPLSRPWENQPRDPGGKGGGQWVRAAARITDANKVERLIAGMEVKARKKKMTERERKKYEALRDRRYELLHSPKLSRLLDPKRYSEKNQED